MLNRAAALFIPYTPKTSHLINTNSFSAKDNQALNNIPEFTDVSCRVDLLQFFNGILGNSYFRLSVFTTDNFNEEISEKRDILQSFIQERNLDKNYTEPVVAIFAEILGLTL